MKINSSCKLFLFQIFTFTLGIVTVGAFTLTCDKLAELFIIEFLVKDITSSLCASLIKSHLRASITINTTFCTNGLYKYSEFVLNKMNIELIADNIINM